MPRHLARQRGRVQVTLNLEKKRRDAVRRISQTARPQTPNPRSFFRGGILSAPAPISIRFGVATPYVMIRVEFYAVRDLICILFLSAYYYRFVLLSYLRLQYIFYVS